MSKLINFQKEYDKHLESNELKAIEAEFKDKPYFIEEKGSAFVAKCCSFFFNIISVGTASTLLYLSLIKFFALSIPYQVLAGIFILLVLTIFEYWKRKHTNKAFRDYYRNETDRQHNYSAIIKMCVFVLISIISSTWGAKKGTVEFAPKAPIIKSDSLLEAKRVYLADLNQQIKDARNTKWAGNTTRKSQKTISLLSAEKVTVTADISDLEKDLKDKNKSIIDKHQFDTVEASYFFACLSIFIELAFLGCIAYVWKFRKKVIFEIGLHRGTIEPEVYIFDKKTASLPKPQTQKQLMANNTIPTPDEQNYNAIAAQMQSNSNDENQALKKSDNSPLVTTAKKKKKPKKKKKKRREIGFKIPKKNKMTRNKTETAQNAENQKDNDTNENRTTKIVNEKNLRKCHHCEDEYIYRHHKQKYCSDKCRIDNWQQRTGKKLRPQKKKK